MRIIVWIVGLGLSTYAGMIIGIITADAVSGCEAIAGNAQHCLGPALLGMAVGAVGGFVLGSLVVVRSGSRAGMRSAAMQTVGFAAVASVLLLMAWLAP